jgi:hypothetical protein
VLERGGLEAEGGAGRAPLADCIDRLAVALLVHTRHEESALRVILKAAGERAPGRDAVMDEGHVAEHEALVTTLRATTELKDAKAYVGRIAEVLADLEWHMANEEETLLADDLLLPDDVVIAYVMN